MNAPAGVPQFPEHLVSDHYESAVISALLQDSQGAAYDLVADVLTERDFWHADLRTIWRAVTDLARSGKPTDVITVAERLEAWHELERIGNLPALGDLAMRAVVPMHLPRYAEILREKGSLRRLWGTAQEIQQRLAATQKLDAAAVIGEAQELVLSVAEDARAHEHVRPATEVLAETVRKVDELAARKSEHDVTGLATGFTDFDAMTTGLHPGDLVVLAARPSMGKTALVLDIIQHVVVAQRRPAMVFSLEMAADALMLRMLAQRSGVNGMRLRTGRLYAEDWPNLSKAQSEIAAAAAWQIDDSSDVSVAEMRSRARRFGRQCGGLALLVVDYLGLIRARDERVNRVEQVAEISRGLKKLAKDLGCPVVALSQLNRGLESRPDKRPIMSDLRDSGAIEQDADLIIGLYRDEMYNRDTPDRGLAELLIMKQRNGPTGMVPLRYDASTTHFADAQGAVPQSSGYKAKRAPKSMQRPTEGDDDGPDF